MNNDLETVVCKNCGNDFHGNYCNICGQKVITNRFTLKILLNDLVTGIFNIEKGIFYTIKYLIINPRKVFLEYLGGKTKSYYNPLKFLFLIAAVSALLAILNHTLENYSNYFAADILEKNSEEIASTTNSLIPFVEKYLNVLTILLIPLFSIGFRLMFYREKLNYTEHLIINCYSYSLIELTAITINITLFFLKFNVLIESISGLMFIVLGYTYFYQRLTKKNIIVTFLKTLFSILIGMILMMIMVSFISIIISIKKLI